MDLSHKLLIFRLFQGLNVPFLYFHSSTTPLAWGKLWTAFTPEHLTASFRISHQGSQPNCSIYLLKKLLQPHQEWGRKVQLKMNIHVQEKIIQHVPLQHFSPRIYKDSIIFGNKIKKTELSRSSENSEKKRNCSISNKKRSSTHAHSHISATDTGKKIKANTEYFRYQNGISQR